MVGAVNAEQNGVAAAARLVVDRMALMTFILVLCCMLYFMLLPWRLLQCICSWAPSSSRQAMHRSQRNSCSLLAEPCILLHVVAIMHCSFNDLKLKLEASSSSVEKI